MAKETKNLGQYFTPEYVADFMIGLSSVAKDAKILEPACGEGVFLKLLEEKGYKNIIGYEVDETLNKITKSKILFESFVTADIKEKYDLVIGNPPYIRWKHLNQTLKEELNNNELWQKYFNSLCDYLCIFVLKSVELLKENGELIFITPEYWINTKHAQILRSYLTKNGYFTNIVHFNETPIFDKVASSILIFKFIKSSDLKKRTQNIKVIKYLSTQRLTQETLSKINNGIQDKKIEVFERSQFGLNERWMLAPSKIGKKLEEYENKCMAIVSSSLFGDEKKYKTLGDIADIGNGMVSGLDRAFQIPKETKLTAKEKHSTISVLKAKNMEQYVHGEITPYIFLNGDVKNEEDLKEKYPAFYEILRQFQDKLELRYNYNRKINYWEWVFLRSFNLFRREKEKIFVPCKERISHKSYFRFSYVPSGIFPTQDVTAMFLKAEVKESIYYILALLNSEHVFEWLKHKGVVKGNIVEFSEKPLASIPVRLIDWQNPTEVKLHEQISSSCKNYILTRDEKSLQILNERMAVLF